MKLDVPYVKPVKLLIVSVSKSSSSTLTGYDYGNGNQSKKNVEVIGTIRDNFRIDLYGIRHGYIVIICPHTLIMLTIFKVMNPYS